MPFLALSLELEAAAAARAEQVCFDAGALSVTLSHAGGQAVIEPAPGQHTLWPHTHVQALFSREQAEPALIARLAAALGCRTEALRAQALADRVWEREWLRDFRAMRFGRRLWVCPHHRRVAQRGAVVVRLDPGLAFGTGTHPSTALCLSWLDAAQLSGRRVIDFGCGSGVLAVAAALLGARQVYAYDVDPQALIATRANAAHNAVGARLRVCARADALPGGCDIVLANILADTLVSLAPGFARHLRRGGLLLLSGVLLDQAEAVMHACSRWFEVRPFDQREGWIALCAIRR